MSPIVTKRLPLKALGRIASLTLLAAALVACRSEQAPPAEARPVGVVTVAAGQFSDDVQLSGEVQAKKDVGLAFRIGGRVLERPVNVGDRVKAGQVIARLEPALEQNALTAAKAALEAARGEVSTARNTYERQERLMAQGFTTRPRYDQARRAQETAQAALENAEAQAELARDRLGFTELRADVAGVVTARQVEPGEVVQPGQVLVQIARDDSRDAVFNVPAALLDPRFADAKIRVALADAPTVTAYGSVREVAPQADPVTRTFAVRVGLQDPPEAMRLGSTVVGTIEVSTAAIVAIPASALTQQGRSPAVWVVDPAKSTVSLRDIDVLRFDPSKIILSQGLAPGEMIVSAGVQALHPGQRVRPLPGSQSAAASPQRP
ncbi:RND family efflux transporter MFP subunit [Bosea sp. BE271]|uniref:efflux RND transporter periplasmic adaptor subunit n=1 Tax=Bosea TaxID=85413 RepID=UPI0028606FFD|nr:MULTISPECIES: efflux RND transporter periplasmic adaptor subunit [Bosea]MDR6831047.1 RND family efflux transporter MFP subunit [Bosea robiniae]MDR6897761.1 RND family efflux transporter MFP subunit [Bosea sp. BE109]MDR7141158.1 RND family efflux transporter MFP subunit [Bosea sp. BE168]MDR7177704.1 RND family efflux transporter MFP subunit [Bosea sp. BE271]